MTVSRYPHIRIHIQIKATYDIKKIIFKSKQSSNQNNLQIKNTNPKFHKQKYDNRNNWDGTITRDKSSDEQDKEISIPKVHSIQRIQCLDSDKEPLFGILKIVLAYVKLKHLCRKTSDNQSKYKRCGAMPRRMKRESVNAK